MNKSGIDDLPTKTANNSEEFKCYTCRNNLSCTNCELTLKDCQIYECSFCEFPFTKCDYSIYACLNCNQFLHKSCANFPQQIHHPFHPRHPLVFHPRPAVSTAGRPSQCQACGGNTSSPTFRCSLCEFTLDIHCASLVPSNHTLPSVLQVPNRTPPNVPLVPVNHKPPTVHAHSLIHCKNPKTIPYHCFGCGLEFGDTILVCLSCSMLLDESCAKLPREIHHSLHASHFLTIYENSTNSSKQRLIDCKACLNLSEGFGYRCIHCKFYLDLKCSFENFPMINSELHHHSLALFTVKSNGFRCKICYKFCTGSFFRCVGCNFNLHAHCLSNLPTKIKHKCHLHWLSLTSSWIRDQEDEDEDAELYCDACEERRRLVDPTYYCEECHFVAHVHCVISEVLPHLERDISHLKLKATMNGNTRDDGDKNTSDSMSITQEEIEAKFLIGEIDKDIKMLQIEVDSLTAKLHKLKQSIVHQQH
ncbi:hypothetical protein LguiA_034104 [Lonicera macranthoides]